MPGLGPGARAPAFGLGEAFLALGAPAARNVRRRVAACQAVGADEALGGALPTIFAVMIQFDPVLMLHEHQHRQGGEDASPEREANHQIDEDIVQGPVHPTLRNSGRRRMAGYPPLTHHFANGSAFISLGKCNLDDNPLTCHEQEQNVLPGDEWGRGTMLAPGRAGASRLIQLIQDQRNATAAGAFGRRPVTSGEIRSASAAPAMRNRDRTGVLVA